MPRLFPDIDQQILDTRAYSARRERIASTIATVSPEHRNRIGILSRLYPGVSPGVARSLAQSDLPFNHPVTQFAAQQSYLMNHSRTGSWDGSLGSPTPAPRSTADNPNLQSVFEGIRNTRLPRPNFPSAVPRNTTPEEQDARVVKRAEGLNLIDQETGLLVNPGPDAPRFQQDAFWELVDLVEASGQPHATYIRKDTGHLYKTDFASGLEHKIDPTSGQPLEAEGGEFEDTGMAEATYLETPEGRDFSRAIGELRNNADPSLSAPAHEAVTLPHQFDVLQTINDRLAGNPGSIAPAVRPIFTAFDAPVQELQGLIRNIYGEATGEDVNWLESQSDAGIVLPKLIKNISPWSENTDIDVGDGFFVDPESAVARERRAREAQRGQIGGHNITLGRIAADVVTEPDTRAFDTISGLVDASVQLVDPTAWALGGVGKVGTARRTFRAVEAVDEQAGLLNSARRYVRGPTAERWMSNNPKVIDRLAEIRDPYDIAKLTNFKLDPDLTARLARTNNSFGVRLTLKGAINRGTIRHTTDITGSLTQRGINKFGQYTNDAISLLNPRHTPRPIRIFGTMPNRQLDLADKASTTRILRNQLINANAPEDDIRNIYNRIATADSNAAMSEAVSGTQGAVRKMLKSYGIEDDDVLDSLTHVNISTEAEELRGLVNDIGSDTPDFDLLTIDGKPAPLLGPHLLTEHTNRFAYLPDPRAVRRLTSKYTFLTTKQSRDTLPILRKPRELLGRPKVTPTGEPRLPLSLLDSFTSDILKPLWLLRLAWPIRVIGEEQLRLSTTGLDSAFSGHPLAWLATVIGNDSNRLGRVLNTVTPGLKPAITKTPTGDILNELDELQAASYSNHNAWLDRPGVVRTASPTVLASTPQELTPEFAHAWAEELTALHRDPVSHKLSNSTMDEARQWLTRGEGRTHLQQLQRAHPGKLQTDEQIEHYLTVVNRRIERSTSSDTALLDAVRTGTFGTAPDGTPLSLLDPNAPKLNPALTSHLKTRPDVAPPSLVGTVTTATPENTRVWNRVTDIMMHTLMGVPTATLSRAPAFKQYLWKYTADLLPFADEAARASILSVADTANLSKRQLRNLNRQATRAAKPGALTATEVEDLAKGYALDEVNDLLYTLQERSQFNDILRNVIPFGEAWKEVLTRWSKLMVQKGGRPMRRAQQAIQGARGEQFGEYMGAPEGKGFFYKNEFGEEVFVYPGSQWFTNAVTGMPVPLSGRVQGLNLFGSFFPSLGPAAQIPAAWFLQDKPTLNEWREVLLPFGGPGAEESSDIFTLRPYLPGWGKTLMDVVTGGGEDDRIYNSSVMYADSYLASTGKYPNTPEGQQDRLVEAKRLARNVYITRMIGQFALPTAPSPEWLIKDKDGELLNQRLLSEEFWDMVEETNNYESAVQWFLESYGEQAMGAIVPHSRAVLFGVPTSVEGAAWVSRNPDVKSSFPLTYGMFAPEGEFDQATYVRNFTDETREAIRPEEWQMLRDTLLGNYWYDRAVQMLGEEAGSPNEEQRNWLREQRDNIEEAYPYFGRRVGLSERPTTDEMVEELYEASEHRTIRRTEAGRALRKYLNYRDQAVAQAEEAGLVGFKEANAMASTREWLRQHGTRLVAQYPTFRGLWDMVFLRELSEGTEQRR